MPLSDSLKQELQNFRRELHQYPETAFEEGETAERLLRFLQPLQPSKVWKGVGGTGLVVRFDFGKPGPVIAFRAELDALPIEEVNDIPHASTYAGKGHLCGHDGHATNLLALAQLIKERPFSRGSLQLLFQPAEETGEGAKAMLQDPQWEECRPDYIFGLHNLPGFPMGTVVLRKGVFASASTGVEIRLQGKTAHAAYPHKGVQPAPIVAELLQDFATYPEKTSGFSLCTPIFVRMGSPAYGTAAGDAELGFTLRSYETRDLKDLKRLVEEKIEQINRDSPLEASLRYREPFHSTKGQPELIDAIADLAQEAGHALFWPETPFRWSEDFGRFCESIPGAFFGIGSGEQQPVLHHPDFDYPDALIEPSARLFYRIAEHLLED